MMIKVHRNDVFSRVSNSERESERGLLFRMGRRGWYHLSNQPDYLGQASKLQNVVFGVWRLRMRGARAQV